MKTHNIVFSIDHEGKMYQVAFIVKTYEKRIYVLLPQDEMSIGMGDDTTKLIHTSIDSFPVVNDKLAEEYLRRFLRRCMTETT